MPESIERPRVLLADDHLVLRDGLRAILKEEGFEVIAEAADGQEALELTSKLSPDLVILDISMPRLNGIDAAREIRKVCPNAKILLLTMHTEDRYILAGLRAGVTGYILKSKAASTLIQAIESVQRGDVYLSPEMSKAVVNAFVSRDQDALSGREREVLQLTAEGKNIKEVAGILKISVKTAEAHRASMMSKLNLRDTASLIRYAIRQGLITPE
jgi:two-component system response regulator NreC